MSKEDELLEGVDRMRILHLTLKRKWFGLIASGKKTEEYRQDKRHWISRLAGQEFDEVHFRNGYSPTSPFMRVKCNGVKYDICERHRFVISLGKILEIRNYPDSTQREG